MFGFDQGMIFRIPALLVALTVHEYAHARAAVALGDLTPKFLGRLTLNPVAHLDPIGLIMLWLFRFGWAKPVPVNYRNFKNGRQGVMLVSLAGPAANIITAFVSMLAMGLLAKIGFLPLVLERILWLTFSYNIVFAIFNLIPVPPLDGSKILMSLLPGRQAYAFERLEPYGPIILIALVYLGVIGTITYPLEVMVSTLIRGLVTIII